MPYHGSLAKISILVKTFLRDNHLAEAIAGVLDTLPEARLIVVDDGVPTAIKSALYEKLRAAGHVVLELSFDEGFGRKSNAAIEPAQDREYLLVASDDFDFRPPSVRQGIDKLVAVLDGAPDIAIASGRVNGVRYEGNLIDEGSRVREEYITLDNPQITNGVTWHHADLTVNYSLVRSRILGFGEKQIHWLNGVKIGGGEHGYWFICAKRADHRVAWVPGVDIKEQSFKLTDPRYQEFRARARHPGRPCFREIGVHEYVLFSGAVEKA